jgi:hypothetical protein
MQVRFDQKRHLCGINPFAVNGTCVHLGKSIVQGLPVAEGFMDGRVEAIKNAELELVRTLKEVLQIGKREHNVCDPRTRGRREALAPRVIRLSALYMLRHQDGVPELRGTRVAIVFASDGRPRHMQVFLTPGHRHIEEPALVFYRALVPLLPFNPGTR